MTECAAPRRGCIVPSLLVRDLAETVAFYATLGFDLTAAYPDADQPTWAEVSRDSIVFQFYTRPPTGTLDTPQFSGTFYIHVDSIEPLLEDLRGKVAFAWGPEIMDYGLREFAIQDPNGYYIAFAEPA